MRKDERRTLYEAWADQINQWASSGLSQRGFCKTYNLKRTSLRYRLDVLRKEAPELLDCRLWRPEEYYGRALQQAFFGYSQIKAFMDCEARALAEINGSWQPEPSKAFLVGSYCDAALTDDLEAFKSEHPEIFTRAGELKAEFRQAEVIVDRIRREPLMMEYLSGEHQRIMAAELFDGIGPFKIRMDSYLPGRAIVDLKVLRDFNPVFVEGSGRVDFVDGYAYDIQGAIYQAVEQKVTGRKEPLPFIIAAATKQDPPDVRLFQIPQHRLDTALKIIENTVDRFQAIKAGFIEPKRCERCAYCRSTRKLTGIEVIELE